MTLSCLCTAFTEEGNTGLTIINHIYLFTPEGTTTQDCHSLIMYIIHTRGHCTTQDCTSYIMYSIHIREHHHTGLSFVDHVHYSHQRALHNTRLYIVINVQYSHQRAPPHRTVHHESHVGFTSEGPCLPTS